MGTKLVWGGLKGVWGYPKSWTKVRTLEPGYPLGSYQCPGYYAKNDENSLDMGQLAGH